jgi:hypothetical protein
MDVKNQEPSYRGCQHREDGSVLITTEGDMVWHIKGRRHREDGPAIIFKDGRHQWWVDNKMLPNEEIEQWVRENSIIIPFDRETQVEFLLTWT